MGEKQKRVPPRDDGRMDPKRQRQLPKSGRTVLAKPAHRHLSSLSDENHDEQVVAFCSCRDKGYDERARVRMGSGHSRRVKLAYCREASAKAMTNGEDLDRSLGH